MSSKLFEPSTERSLVVVIIIIPIIMIANGATIKPVDVIKIAMMIKDNKVDVKVDVAVVAVVDVVVVVVDVVVAVAAEGVEEVVVATIMITTIDKMVDAEVGAIVTMITTMTITMMVNAIIMMIVHDNDVVAEAVVVEAVVAEGILGLVTSLRRVIVLLAINVASDMVIKMNVIWAAFENHAVHAILSVTMANASLVIDVDSPTKRLPPMTDRPEKMDKLKMKSKVKKCFELFFRNDIVVIL